MKPVVGVTCNFNFRDIVGLTAQTGLPGQEWHLISDHYLAAVERAGMCPVILPVTEDFEEIKDALRRLDGIVISGGCDVDPSFYKTRLKPYCGTLVPRRDRLEINIVNFAMNELHIPLLGICRGIQVMNVAGGGTLYQDLMIEGQFEQHYCEMSPINNPIHTIQPVAGSRLEKVYGSAPVLVNSFHHQAVKDVAPGYRATAHSDDGVIEAIEYEGDCYAVGVQWHPEMMYDNRQQWKLFEDFASACRQEKG